MKYNIDWIITYNCNYNCWYCGSHKAEEFYSASIADKVIDFILNTVYKMEDIEDGTVLAITGGEPTLHPEFNHIIDNLELINNFKISNILVRSNLSTKLSTYYHIIDKIDRLSFAFTFHNHHTSYDEFMNKLKQLINYSGKRVNYKIYYNLHKNNRLSLDDIYKMFESVLNDNVMLTFNNIIVSDADIVDDVIVNTTNKSDKIRYADNTPNPYYLKKTFCHITNAVIHPNGFLYNCYQPIYTTPIVDLSGKNAASIYKMRSKTPILCQHKFCCDKMGFKTLDVLAANNALQI